jgi:hypothetical protein
LTERKAADRQLSKLQASLEAGDLIAVADGFSAGTSTSLLTRFRERKLILRAPIRARKAVAEILLRSAGVCLEPAQLGTFDRYLRFSLAVDAARRRSLERVHVQLRQMPRCSTADLLAVGEAVFDWYVAKLMKGADVYSVGASVAERERRLHDLNGALNDVGFAVARAVNECSRVALIETERRLGKEQRNLAAYVLRRVVKSAGQVNSFEWFFDSVAYGDFVVAECGATPSLTFRLEFADARRYLLQTLAIRRRLVLTLNQRREPRYVREKLEETRRPALNQAVDHYLSEVGSPTVVNVDLTRAEADSKQSLALIDAADDLLFAASRFDPKVAAYYIIAMAMRCYSVAARAIRADPRTGARSGLASPAIPLAQIACRIDDSADGLWVATALENLTSELPARSHFALMDRPFVKDGLYVARPFLGGDFGTWNITVRESLIQGGALGKDIGAIWEDFYAGSFADSDWRIVGRGVKLKRDGHVLTDVDLLLLREDLLLVVQIKAMIGSGATVYDHWKNRQTIELGCAQARIAAEFLEADANTLVSLCGKRGAARVKHVQPVVLTNVHHFDGWTSDDVPVIGEVTRKAICEGAKVEYFDGNSGEVLHTHHFVKREDLTTGEILRLLGHPVELDVAAEGTEIQHRMERVGDLTFLIPEFAIREDLSGPPTHEPNLSKVPSAQALD